MHVVVYPSEAPALLTAKAMAVGSLFGAIGGGVVGARAAVRGAGAAREHRRRKSALDEIEAADGVAYRRMISDAITGCATELGRQFRGEARPQT